MDKTPPRRKSAKEGEDYTPSPESVKKLKDSLDRPSQMAILTTIPKSLPTDAATGKGRKLPKNITDFNYKLGDRATPPQEESTNEELETDLPKSPTIAKTTTSAQAAPPSEKKKPRKSLVDKFRTPEHIWKFKQHGPGSYVAATNAYLRDEANEESRRPKKKKDGNESPEHSRKRQKKD